MLKINFVEINENVLIQIVLALLIKSLSWLSTYLEHCILSTECRFTRFTWLMLWSCGRTLGTVALSVAAYMSFYPVLLIFPLSIQLAINEGNNRRNFQIIFFSRYHWLVAFILRVKLITAFSEKSMLKSMLWISLLQLSM